ncbi:MAG: hypothetical protein H7289_03590 [Mucilaginibacter sp.]|nr:hypothetical protein [Mucilaginibacter sp.]
MTKHILLLLACSLFLLSACKKKTTTPTIVESSLSLKVDGASKTYTGSAIKYTAGGNLQISGLETNAAYNTVFILVPNPKVATFTAANGAYFQLSVQEPQVAAYASDQTGSVTITSLSDTRVAGTFNFVGSHIGSAGTTTKTITEGTFDVAVTAQ